MRLLKQAMAVLGAVVVIAALVAVVTPKAVHAVVATLVRDADNAAKHPFSASCNNLGSGDEAQCVVTTVPAGQELVIQELTISVDTDSGYDVYEVASVTTGGVVVGHYLTMTDAGPCQFCVGSTGHLYTATHPTIFYADPGTAETVAVVRDAVTPDGMAMVATLSGYLVSVP